MRNITVLCFVAINALYSMLHAQTWNFGAEAGYVNNTLAVEEYESTSRNGFKFGVNAE